MVLLCCNEVLCFQILVFGVLESFVICTGKISGQDCTEH